MGRSSGDISPEHDFSKKGRVKWIIVILIFFSPLIVDCAWVVASWWKPLIGFGPEPGFKTPILTFFQGLMKSGQGGLGENWQELRNNFFANPEMAVYLFLMVAGSCTLLMKRKSQ